MKLSNRNRSAAPLALSMTGMIDMVFLLLVFFLATTAFIKAEKHLRSAIGLETDEQSTMDRDLEPAVITLRQIDGRLIYEYGLVTTSSESDILERLRNYRIKTGGAYIRVESGVPFEPVAKLISACKSYGFDPVTYVPDEE